MDSSKQATAATLKLLVTLLTLLSVPVSGSAEDQAHREQQELGRLLFFDPSLSAADNQACASCHDPVRAFSDGRGNRVNGAASVGSDGVSLGDRNTPSIAYANTVPSFSRGANGEFRGGVFHDGRATDLATQALEPPLNPLEMALPNIAAVIARITAKPDYVRRFKSAFGDTLFDDQQLAYQAMASAIAAFQRGPEFSTFDSRYDRYLAGDYVMSTDEELGRRLFFSDLTNCMACHLLRPNEVQANEPFSDHQYHNIGLPMNHSLRRANGRGPDYRDQGLAQNPQVDSRAAAGKFRTPSLRNVAVTGPYMHNGIFQRLETAISFYNQYIVHNQAVKINPETGALWGAPEVSENIALDRLREGQPLGPQRIERLIAFLKTLTDRRYEHLLIDTKSSPGAINE